MPRILTYNVHRCVGTDGRADPQRIAQVIADRKPDIVALQELDVGRARTGHVDQAQAIARLLEMEFHFHPSLTVEEERYGNAVLTALPVRLVRAGSLPGLPQRPLLEPRGALWVDIDLDGVALHVINTHLGFRAPERLAQVEELLSAGWLGHLDRNAPVMLLGDLNALPRSRSYRRLAGRLRDAQRALKSRWPRPTFPARCPMLRIDHILYDGPIEILAAEVPWTPLSRVASDHLPLAIDFRLVAPLGTPP